MKNTKITNDSISVKSIANDDPLMKNPLLKDRLLFDSILRESNQSRRTRVTDRGNSKFAHLVEDRNKVQPDQDKSTLEVDNVANAANQGTVQTLAIPGEWQRVLEQIRIYLQPNSSFEILQASIKHSFLPHTSLILNRQNGVIVVQFVTDSSMVADRLMPQLKSLKNYLEKKLSTPVHVTLRLQSKTSALTAVDQQPAAEPDANIT